MPDQGNVGSQMPNQDNTLSFKPFTVANDGSIATTPSVNKEALTPTSTYFTDTQSATGTTPGGKPVTNSLNTIPPPNAQAAGVSGAAGEGNAFLVPGALVAFFMEFNELATIERQTSLAQEQETLMQMAMSNSLTSGMANEIITAANFEQGSLISSAAASFVDGAASLSMGIAQSRAEAAGEGQLDSEESTLNTQLDSDQADLETARGNITDTEFQETNNNLNKAQDNLNEEETKMEQLDPSSPEGKAQQAKVDEAKEQVENAQEKLQTQKKKLSKEDQNTLNKAEEKVKTSEKDLQHFQNHRLEKLQSMVQFTIGKTQAYSQALSKMISAFSSSANAVLVTYKARAEAMLKMMENYQQTTFKMMDTLNSARGDNSKMIADLMQQLRNFSDAEKKFGTLTAMGV